MSYTKAMDQHKLFLDAAEAKQLNENMVAVHQRCNVLLEENRQLKRENAKLYSVINKIVTMLAADVKEASKGTVDYVTSYVIPAVNAEQRPVTNRRQRGFAPMPPERRKRNSVTDP